MRDVVFLTAKRKATLASSVVRAQQLSAIYSKMRPDLDVGYVEALRSPLSRKLGVTTIINKAYMTSFPSSSLPRRTRGQRYFLDPVDATIREDYLTLVEGIITTNLTSVDPLRAAHPHKKVFYVPLHPNLQVPAHRAQTESFRAAYFGNVFNCRFLPEVQSKCDVEIISTPTDRPVGVWADQLSDFSAHVSFRQPQDWDGTKPFTKGIFAALTGAMYVGDPVPEARLLLGDDFPYFVESDTPEAAVDIVLKARQSFGSVEWHEALGKMKVIMEESSLHNVLRQLDSLIKG